MPQIIRSKERIYLEKQSEWKPIQTLIDELANRNDRVKLRHGFKEL